MRHKTVALGPLWFAASALVVMTSFRLHDAHIATRQLLHTDKTMALRVTLLALFTAVAAEDIARVGQG